MASVSLHGTKHGVQPGRVERTKHGVVSEESGDKSDGNEALPAATKFHADSFPLEKLQLVTRRVSDSFDTAEPSLQFDWLWVWLCHSHRQPAWCDGCYKSCKAPISLCSAPFFVVIYKCIKGQSSELLSSAERTQGQDWPLIIFWKRFK